MKKVKKKSLKIRKNIKEAALATFTAGGLSVVMELRRELSEFLVRRYRLCVRDPRDMCQDGAETNTQKSIAQNTVGQKTTAKLVFLSDLHGKKYGTNNQDLLRAVKHEKPDYILIGGDSVTRSKPETDAVALNLIRHLVKICPVYLANGNHEQKMRIYTEEYGNRYEKYMAIVREAGVHVLENASEEVDIKGVPVQISGLELPVKCYARFFARKLQIQDVKDAIGEPNEGRYQILLAHTPVFMPVYQQWGANLTLSGHLHGGIIGLPGIGGLITPQAVLFPKYAGGIYREGKHVGIVSRGLGTHTVNLRFCNPAELVSVALEFYSCENEDNPV